MSDLFSKHRWMGTFFLPNRYKDRFPGEIDYSPEGGVILSYTMVGDEVPPPTEVLHGILPEGKKCTLIGHFDLDLADRNMREGLTYRSGKAGFSFLAIGDFLDAGEKFSDIDFSLANLQEFFFASEYKDQVKYSKDPLHTIDTRDFKLKVMNTAEFGVPCIDITSQLHSSNQTALDSIGQAFQGVRKEFPRDCFWVKKDIAYHLTLNFFEKSTLQEATRHIISLSDLFALLLYKPVYPNSISLKRLSDGNPNTDIEIYPSMIIGLETIKRVIRKRPHWFMPITKFTMPFDAIVDNWLRLPTRPDIVSSIQNETGFQDMWTVRGDIVIYATQLESISHEDDQSNKKYAYPLEKFANRKIQHGIMDIFEKASLEEVGIAIGELRDDIAHVKRRKRWLDKLSLDQLMRIALYLQLTVLGYTLTNIKIPEKVVRDYQHRFSPRSR